MQKKKVFSWPSLEGKRLVKTLLKAKNITEMENLLRDICTITELQALTERLQAAEMIRKGIPYRKISEETGISTATITRVAHWIKHGEGGYTELLERK